MSASSHSENIFAFWELACVPRTTSKHIHSNAAIACRGYSTRSWHSSMTVSGDWGLDSMAKRLTRRTVSCRPPRSQTPRFEDRVVPRNISNLSVKQSNKPRVRETLGRIRQSVPVRLPTVSSQVRSNRRHFLRIEVFCVPWEDSGSTIRSVGLPVG